MRSRQRVGGGITNQRSTSRSNSEQSSRAPSSNSGLPNIEGRSGSGAGDVRPKTSWKHERSDGPGAHNEPARSTTSFEMSKGIPGQRNSGGQGSWFQDPKNRREDNLRPDSKSSRASWSKEYLNEQVEEFQKSYLVRNAPKFAHLYEAFRDTDQEKLGRIDAPGLLASMRRLEIPMHERVAGELIDRCADPGKGMTLYDFRALMWREQPSGPVLDERRNARPGCRGDNSGAKHLWTDARPNGRPVGTLNDTLEADLIASGRQPPRLDGNFSSVRYDIVHFGDRSGPGFDPDPRLTGIPVHNRLSLYSPPPPAGRRVAYDRGDTPYDLVSLRSPRSSGPVQLPVRLSSFARLNRGELPTQPGHFLSRTIF
mmetsp:Transcript_46380/g.122915  ORF Transcript_46380/g.122915 Transcript_46380/m.122915 type:complete len:369 (+) Transcript_46380:55-1161(+)